jgi:hypothetical protein
MRRATYTLGLGALLGLGMALAPLISTAQGAAGGGVGAGTGGVAGGATTAPGPNGTAGAVTQQGTGAPANSVVNGVPTVNSQTGGPAANPQIGITANPALPNNNPAQPNNRFGNSNFGNSYRGGAQFGGAGQFGTGAFGNQWGTPSTQWDNNSAWGGSSFNTPWGPIATDSRFGTPAYNGDVGPNGYSPGGYTVPRVDPNGQVYRYSGQTSDYPNMYYQAAPNNATPGTFQYGWW